MKFSPTEIWNISAEMLHTPEYREKYLDALRPLIPDRNSLILDTACGTGFPSLYLYKNGYKMITCSDGDAESIGMAKEKFQAMDANNVSFHISSWQDLNKNIQEVFDVILNVDNSLVYLDSWSNPIDKISEDEIFENIKHVLKNFYSLLKPGGVCIVALAKNNDRDAENKIIPIGKGNIKIWMSE